MNKNLIRIWCLSILIIGNVIMNGAMISIAIGVESEDIIYSTSFEDTPDGEYPADFSCYFAGDIAEVTTERARSGSQSFMQRSLGYCRGDSLQFELPDILKISVDVYIDEMTGNAWWVTFAERVDEHHSYHLNGVMFNTQSETIRLISQKGSPSIELQSFTDNQWYNVEIIIDYTTSTIDAYINGVLRAENVPAEPKATSNTLMFGTSDCKSFVDNVVIAEILTDEPEEEESNPTPEQHPPLSPINPSPVDGAINVPLITTLEWYSYDPDGDPLTYEVHMGTTPITEPPNAIMYTDSYNTGTLEPGTKYWWYITACDDHGHRSVSSVWSFTTVASEADTVYDSVFYVNERDYEVLAEINIDGQTTQTISIPSHSSKKLFGYNDAQAIFNVHGYACIGEFVGYCTDTEGTESIGGGELLLAKVYWNDESQDSGLCLGIGNTIGIKAEGFVCFGSDGVSLEGSLGAGIIVSGGIEVEIRLLEGDKDEWSSDPTNWQTPHIVDWSISRTRMSPGDTFTVTVEIDNPTYYRSIWLGTSIRDSQNKVISDPEHDEYLWIDRGSNTLTRTFRVPLESNSGEYDLAIAIWQMKVGGYMYTQYDTTGWVDDALSVSSNSNANIEGISSSSDLAIDEHTSQTVQPIYGIMLCAVIIAMVLCAISWYKFRK